MTTYSNINVIFGIFKYENDPIVNTVKKLEWSTIHQEKGFLFTIYQFMNIIQNKNFSAIHTRPLLSPYVLFVKFEI